MLHVSDCSGICAARRLTHFRNDLGETEDGTRVHLGACLTTVGHSTHDVLTVSFVRRNEERVDRERKLTCGSIWARTKAGRMVMKKQAKTWLSAPSLSSNRSTHLVLQRRKIVTQLEESERDDQGDGNVSEKTSPLVIGVSPKSNVG